MTLQETFYITKIKAIITIDDDWDFNRASEAVLFDCALLGQVEQTSLFSAIESKNQVISEHIRKAIRAIQESGVCLNDKAKWQIYRYFSDPAVLSEIKGFTDEDVNEVSDIVALYGLGLKKDGMNAFAKIIDDTNSNSLPLRVFTDFTSEDATMFETVINELTAIGEYVLCVIDDQLGRNKRAPEIIRFIENNDSIRDKTICVLFTSSDNTVNQKRNKNMFVEYVNKSDNAIDSFKRAYAKSLFRILLSKYKKLLSDASDVVFDEMFSKSDTALFLSQKAAMENISSFECIDRLIKAKERFSIETASKDELKTVTMLSNLLDVENMSDSNDDTYVSEENLYSTETFDYSVNFLHKAIDIGDVFRCGDNYFVIVGQECDLAVRSDGTRKTEVFEFVKAKIKEKLENKYKNENGYEDAIISGFSVDGQNKYLLINCGKRFYAKPDIFDLCVFNEDGQAKISTDQELQTDIRAMISQGMSLVYKGVQKKYENYFAVKKRVQDDSVFAAFVKDIGIMSEKNQTVAWDAFSLSDDKEVSYNVKRVCRLRKHARLILKLNLDYRGRQAEDGACFSRWVDFKYVINDKICDGSYLMSTKNAENESVKLCKRTWMVKVADIKEFFLDDAINSISDDVIFLDGKTEERNGYVFKKAYNKNSNTLQLSIVKK